MEFEAKYHFYYAVIAFSLGVVARGISYIVETPLCFFKIKPLKVAGQISACLIAALLFIFGKNLYNFPPVRAYAVICFLFGFLLISKICDKRIDFFSDRLYNKLKIKYLKHREKRKKRIRLRLEKRNEMRREKELKNNLRKKNKRGNRKIKKSGGFGDRVGGFAFGDFNFDNGLSISRHKVQRKRDKRDKRRNSAARTRRRAT